MNTSIIFNYAPNCPSFVYLAISISERTRGRKLKFLAEFAAKTAISRLAKKLPLLSNFQFLPEIISHQANFRAFLLSDLLTKKLVSGSSLITSAPVGMVQAEVEGGV